jgi:hypothetical protein
MNSANPLWGAASTLHVFTGISDLNELLKSSATTYVPQLRQISMLADIGNQCDHNRLQQPTPRQVKDLIDGAEKVLKTGA